MKAIILVKPKQPELTVLPTPLIGEREVLIKVEIAGVCGSDIQKLFSSISPYSYPKTNILGHEAAGKVVEIGAAVTEFQPGARVAIKPLISCKQCVYCTEGREELCSNLQSIGKSRAGAFAEYIAVPSENVRYIPSNISYKAAALTDVVAVAIHAIHLAQSPRSMRVLILGDGAIALACAQILQIDNNSVTLIGKNKANLDLAKGLGIHVLQLGQKELENKPIYDVVFECVGKHQSDTINTAITQVKPGGKIIVLGVFAVGYIGQVEVRNLFYKEISLLGANSYGIWDGVDEFDVALSLLSEGKLNPAAWITHQFKLEAVADLMYSIEHKSISKLVKAVFIPSEG